MEEKETLVEEAVKNLVNVISGAVSKENEKNEVNESTPHEEEVYAPNTYYKEGVPFLVEMTFEKWTPEIEQKLMSSFMHDTEIFNGLKITKMYKASMTTESLYLDSISKKLDDIKTDIENFRSESELKMKRKLMV